MAPFRALALIFLASTAAASDLHARQLLNTTEAASAVISAVGAATSLVVAVIGTNPVIAATTVAPAAATTIIPVTSAASVPTASAAVSSAAVTTKDRATTQQTVAPSATAATPSDTSAAPTATVTLMVASSNGQISTSDPQADTTSAISTGAIIGLSIAAAAIFLLVAGVCLFRKRSGRKTGGIESVEAKQRAGGFRRRSSDVNAAAFLCRPSTTTVPMETGKVTGAAIDHPTFNGPVSGRPSFGDAPALEQTRTAAPVTDYLGQTYNAEPVYPPATTYDPYADQRQYASDYPLQYEYPSQPQQQPAHHQYYQRPLPADPQVGQQYAYEGYEGYQYV
ncbi:hypothetical protein HKX48_000423 [Thoreauomyces humboldtii]|nr:hypothetical protein HKX48_000423 [Thoreauomyces humboldtii]